MGKSWKTTKPFLELDAVLWQYFNNLDDAYLRFGRVKQVEGAYVTYVTRPIIYGKIELRKDGDLSELSIIDPPEPRQDGMTPTIERPQNVQAQYYVVCEELIKTLKHKGLIVEAGEDPQPAAGGAAPSVLVNARTAIIQIGTVNQVSMGDITTGGDVTGRDKIATENETKQ